MSNLKYLKIIFLLIIFLFSFLIFLNYTVKTPNDGVLYLSSAIYFLENNLLIDTTRSVENILLPFPTSQIGITIFLVFLIYFFKSFWIVVYVLLLSITWIVLIKKLYKFSLKNFNNNHYLAMLFSFLVFFNYDYLISASSFYNEALYYPFLIFSFLKIINLIEKEKNFFKKSNFFIIFLALGSILRLQHFVLIASLGFYFLFCKKFKEFSFILLIALVNIGLFLTVTQHLQDYSSNTQLSNLVNKSYSSDFFGFFKNYFTNFSLNLNEWNNSNLLFKNLKVHLTSYSHFFNFPKIVDITLPSNAKSPLEFVFVLFTIIIITILIKYFIHRKLNKKNSFLLIYFLIASLFLICLTDLISRYFLLGNFCLIYFFSDYLKFSSFRIKKSKYFVSFFIIFFSILSIYGLSYFYNYGLSYKKPTFQILNLLKNYKNDLNIEKKENQVFISKYNYQIRWILNQPSIKMDQYLKLRKEFNPQKEYYFIGSLEEYNSLDSAIINKNNITIENIFKKETPHRKISIWKMHLNY